MATDLLAVADAADDLLSCVCRALTAMAQQNPGVQGCPCLRTVVPGAQPAWDGCDNGCDTPVVPPPDASAGSLYVNTVRMYTSTPGRFPAEVSVVRDLGNCEITVDAVEFEITVLRCMPLDNPSQQFPCPPGSGQLRTSFERQSMDMAAVRRGIECCYSGTLQTAHRNRKGRRWVMGNARTVGPQGGCVGFTQRVTVELADCAPCSLVTPTEPNILEM